MKWPGEQELGSIGEGQRKEINLKTILGFSSIKSPLPIKDQILWLSLIRLSVFSHQVTSYLVRGNHTFQKLRWSGCVT